MSRYSQGRIMGAVILIVLLTTFVGLSRPAVHAVAGDWPMYLGDLARHSFNSAETIINRTTAPNLKVHWMHQAGGQVASQPVEANGLIYWGSWDGLEHATDPSTGNDRWAVNLGQTSSCLPYSVGVQSTATVTSVPINGVSTTVVFVGGGQAQLYALDANSGAILWNIRLGDSPAHFLYSSPDVFNGSVYIGVASSNDCPLVQGQMVQVNASTGRLQHIFNVVPNGCTGGGVWGSPAIDTGTGKLYFATGNRGQCSQSTPYERAVVELNATDLSLVAAWQIPPSELLVDGDFGSTPTLFQVRMGGILRKLLVQPRGNTPGV